MYTQQRLYSPLDAEMYKLGLAEAIPSADLRSGASYMLRLMMKPETRRSHDEFTYGIAHFACTELVERDSGLLVRGDCGNVDTVEAEFIGEGDILVPRGLTSLGSSVLLEVYAVQKEDEDPLKALDSELDLAWGRMTAGEDASQLVPLKVRRLELRQDQ